MSSLAVPSDISINNSVGHSVNNIPLSDSRKNDSGGALASSLNHPELPANGGFKAWTQVAGSFLVFFNTWGIVNSFGVFQTFYQSDLLASESASSISWIGSIQAFLLLFGSAIVGPFFDVGYLRILLAIGTFFLVFGMMMLSLCTSFWQVFLAQGLAVGIGLGCLFLPSVAVIPHHFTTKKSVAVGIASAGGSVGGVFYPIIFRQLQPRVGFPWAIRIMGFIVLATLSVPLLGLRLKMPPASKRRDFLDLAAFKNAPYTLFCIGQFFGFMSIYITLFYIQLFALQRTDVDPNFAFYLLSIVNAASVAGRVLPNFVADKVGPLNVLIPLTFATSTLTFGWIGVRDTPGIVLFCILYGFFQGPFVSLPPSIMVTLSPDLHKIGIRLGMMLAISGFGSLIGEPVAGAILRDQNGWVGMQVYCGVLFVISGIFTLAVRLNKAGSSWKSKA